MPETLQPATPQPDEPSPAVDSTTPPTAEWRRATRKNILLWAFIGFVIPVVLLLLLRPWLRESGSFTVRRELPTKAITAVGMLLATWVVARRERRPLADYGLPASEAFGARFWEGAIWGFVMLSAIPLALLAWGHFQIDSVALVAGPALRYAILWALTFLGVSFGEELAFRSYLLAIATRRIGFWRAALAVSIGFAIAHLGNGGENALGIFQVFATGMLLCFTFRRTGSLWFALGFHAAWDWAQTFFFGTPDSGLLGDGHLLNTSVHGPIWLTGGSAGPEGSVLALIILGVTALLIHLRFPTALFPAQTS